jgi:hypothetical protein
VNFANRYRENKKLFYRLTAVYQLPGHS